MMQEKALTSFALYDPFFTRTDHEQ